MFNKTECDFDDCKIAFEFDLTLLTFCEGKYKIIKTVEFKENQMN